MLIPVKIRLKEKIIGETRNLEFKGKVTELLPNAMFRVKLKIITKFCIQLEN